LRPRRTTDSPRRPPPYHRRGRRGQRLSLQPGPGAGSDRRPDRRGATDFLRGDVVIKGGITGLMKIAHLAEAFGLNCEVHDSYNALNNVAARHVMMAIDNCDWLEVLAFTAPATTASTTSATA
jgi:L-alanine-DL-glutamate epimerase-like enolase superfamily enzyme